MTKSTARKGSARKARSARAKKTSQRTAKARDRNQASAPKVVALRNNIAAETVHETHRMTDAQFDPFRHSQLPDTLRVLAERNVAQAREVYESSKNTLQAVLESWQKSFGAAGQSAVALNRKMMNAAERNMETSFDLAIGLAGARNLGEVMELQAAYWHKITGVRQSQPKQLQGELARRPSVQASLTGLCQPSRTYAAITSSNRARTALWPLTSLTPLVN